MKMGRNTWKLGQNLQWMVTTTLQIYAAPQKNSLVHKEKIHMLQGRILLILKTPGSSDLHRI